MDSFAPNLAVSTAYIGGEDLYGLAALRMTVLGLSAFFDSWKIKAVKLEFRHCRYKLNRPQSVARVGLLLH